MIVVVLRLNEWNLINHYKLFNNCFTRILRLDVEQRVEVLKAAIPELARMDRMHNNNDILNKIIDQIHGKDNTIDEADITGESVRNNMRLVTTGRLRQYCRASKAC